MSRKENASGPRAGRCLCRRRSGTHWKMSRRPRTARMRISSDLEGAARPTRDLLEYSFFVHALGSFPHPVRDRRSRPCLPLRSCEAIEYEAPSASQYPVNVMKPRGLALPWSEPAPGISRSITNCGMIFVVYTNFVVTLLGATATAAQPQRVFQSNGSAHFQETKSPLLAAPFGL